MTTAAVVDVLLPRLAEAMTEGTLLAWLRSDGEVVEAGDALVEIETDKSSVVHPAEASGVLRIVEPEGAVVPVGAVIAHIGPGSADPAADAPPARPDPPPPPVPAAEAPAAPPAPTPAPVPTERGAASPTARRLAARHGVDLALVEGHGPGGMVLRSDVMRAAGLPAVERSAPPAPPAAAPAQGEVTLVERSRNQRIVAERMSESHATIPDFTMSIDVSMDRAVALRADLKAAAGEAPAPSVNDLVVKAVALALRAVPQMNAAMREGRVERFSRVNVGVAVATSETLTVPVIADADRRSLGQIAAESRRLAAAVRDGVVTPSDLEGGTFTISNLGMHGVRSFAAVILPPQAGILAVGVLREEAVVSGGVLRAGHVMSLTLSGDHRILNGVDGAQFLAAIRASLEQPLSLLI